MRGSNWDRHVRSELDAARERMEDTGGRLSRSEHHFARLLPPGVDPTEVKIPQLRRDPRLRDAREAFRRDFRDHVTLRDESAGFEADLAMGD